MVQPPVVQPLLKIPEDMSTSGPDPASEKFAALQKELLGLSQTVKSLSTQLTTPQVVSPPIQTVVPPPLAVATPGVKIVKNTGLQGSDISVTVPNTTVQSHPKTTKKRKAPKPVDPALLEPGSEIDTPVEDSSSDEEVGEGDSESSQDEFEVEEGILDWPTMVSQIVAHFPDRIGPEPKSPVKSRIRNLGGLTVAKTSERVRLPLYEPIREALEKFAGDIKAPATKARAKRDSKPLGKGSFPSSTRDLPVQALSELTRFNHPAQVEVEVEKLLPRSKTSFNIQGRFTEEHLRMLERDMRVSLSSASYTLWALEFAANSLQTIADGSEDRDMLVPSISACRHAMSFLSTVVDRSSTSLNTTLLARRDSYLAQADPLLAEGEQVSLRAADMLDTRLFAGQIPTLLPKLESRRKEASESASVSALTSLAKKGVEGSTAPASSGSSFKRRSKKHHKKDKKDKKTANTGSFQKASSEATGQGASVQRTFRAKGKKTTKK